MKTTRTKSRCECGKVKSQYASHCKACDKKRSEARYEEARKIVASSICPKCGSGLRHNLSILGWWQCEQYGAEGFRKDDSKPSCSFQTFTQ
jgi:hypothetical protein